VLEGERSHQAVALASVHRRVVVVEAGHPQAAEEAPQRDRPQGGADLDRLLVVGLRLLVALPVVDPDEDVPEVLGEVVVAGQAEVGGDTSIVNHTFHRFLKSQDQNLTLFHNKFHTHCRLNKAFLAPINAVIC
jgi:hypothetical protein